MGTQLLKYVIFILATLSLAACSSNNIRPNASGTQVDLSKMNYRVVHANAIGSSAGFKILGFIPIVSPSYTSAMSDLYKEAGAVEGRAQALANFAHEDSNLYFLLFSIPRLKVRADVIEFIEH